MAFNIGHVYDPTIDHLSDIVAYRERLEPGRVNCLVEGGRSWREALHEIRRISSEREAVGMSPDGSWMHVAGGVPNSLVAMIENIDPEFFRNDHKFYTWVRRHPVFARGYFKSRAPLASRV